MTGKMFRTKGIRTRTISNLDLAALVPLAIAKDTIANAIELAERDWFDDGNRDDGDEQEDEGGEEQDGQRGRWSQHRGGGVVAGCDAAMTRWRSLISSSRVQQRREWV